jgi:actin-related protein
MQLKRSWNQSPVLLAIPSSWSRPDRERITQIFFEKFNVPGLYLADYPLMTLYGFGQHITGLVISVENDRTSVTPIIDTAVQYHACADIPVGMFKIYAYLKQLLESDAQFKQEYGMPIDDELLRYLTFNVCEFMPIIVAGVDTVSPKKKETTRVSVTFNGKTVRALVPKF